MSLASLERIIKKPIHKLTKREWEDLSYAALGALSVSSHSSRSSSHPSLTKANDSFDRKHRPYRRKKSSSRARSAGPRRKRSTASARLSQFMKMNGVLDQIERRKRSGK